MKKQRKHYTPAKVAILKEASAGASADLGAVRQIGAPAHGLLPLAEGVLRERRGRLRAEIATKPLSRGRQQEIHAERDRKLEEARKML